MARYTQEHKEATRRRMIETAARRFKADGFDGAGIATLVADAGLTNGAFYGHFASKDDLIASVVAQQLADRVALIDALPAGPEAISDYIQDYLSPAHRDDRADGCPSAALLDEVGRCDLTVREAYTAGSLALLEAVTRRLDGDPERVAAQAIGLYALLVGSVQLARAVTDPDLSDAILAAAYSNAMTLIGATEGAGSPHSQEQQ